MGRGMWRVALCVAAAMGISSGTMAQTADAFETGNGLDISCGENDGQQRPFPFGACYGYSVAIADVMHRGISISGFRACIPANITKGQVVDAVRTWLRKSPQQWHYGAAGLVAQALATAFPCQ